MLEDEIIKLFSEIETGKGFRKLSQLKLNSIYSFLQKNLKQKKHWNQKALFRFCAKHNLNPSIFLYQLQSFAIEISERKRKKFLTLFSFINKINNNPSKKVHLSSSEKYLKLKKNEVPLSQFLNSIKQISDCLENSDKEVVKGLNALIHTGYSDKTLLKYYYKRN
ncbi:hypothetical protein JQC67_07815 [Aurantibacter crassamenti]|uniref:hypothetical protein n=1 Tax=Aurantibacter crassamenti TaxID=1837375 RepID=UPI001939FD1F|nr:hypothetical protein [Aurantibacter crassamenti]MBM1106038.1 hypothetical protein [Aurantibacter crassamenti]